MTKTNLENPMILNSHLINNNKILINSKIIQLVLPTTTNLNIPGFFPKRLAGQSLKNMVISMREKLKVNPVFFSIATINSFDKMYCEIFEYNNSIPVDEIEGYRSMYEYNIDFIVKLLSLDSVEFGKKIWDVEKDKLI